MSNKAIKYPFLSLASVNEPYKQELYDAVHRVIDSGRYIGGDEVSAFEQELSVFVEAPFVVGVSNGFDALKLILRAYIELGRLSVGDEIIIPANTYIASVLAATDCGLCPKLVDPDEDSMNISGEILDRNITSKTRAVMPVHLYGRVAWDPVLAESARRHDLIVIEDNAQAIGALSTSRGLYDSFRTGALGDAGAFSFYPTKNVGALGDAGAVVTHDLRLANAVRALSNYGSDTRYHNIYAGYNCRLDPIQAAMLRVKLKYADKDNADRFARAVTYNNTIDNQLVVKPKMSSAGTDCVWHQYVVRCHRRNELQKYLTENGVGTDIHYATPPHLQPCYRHLSYGRFPITERLANEVLSLPIAAGHSIKDIAEISRIINSFS